MQGLGFGGLGVRVYERGVCVQCWVIDVSKAVTDFMKEGFVCSIG